MKISFLTKGKALEHSFSNCVGAGRANEGLRADWQEHLKQAVKHCGFRYLRFHGLLHDDMHVYKEINGTPVYNFQYIDALFDFMLDTGIRPFVEFGFMPEAMASGTQTQFWWKGNVTPPADYSKWGALIRKCVEHWIFRYGRKEVRRWYFEVWNEADLHAFWSGTRSEYFELYRYAVKAIKEVDQSLRVGGPATSNFVPDARFDGEKEDKSLHATFRVEDINSLSWKGVWIREFLDWCEREQLPVDFVSTHPYPTDFALDGHGHSRGASRYRDSLYDDVMWLKQVIADSAYPEAELHLTEWSCSPSSRDYSHDYLPVASYILRSCLLCENQYQSLSYWTFTDVFEEVGAGPKPFHGGFGMITLQGVKKPSFHAYRMLNQLGSEELARAEGYILTKKKDRLSAAFYHYPDEYTGTVPMSGYPDQKAAQECQGIGSDRSFDLTVTDMKPGETYVLRVLHPEDIAVVKWNAMGAPSELTREQEEELRRQGECLRETPVTVDENGTLHLRFTLPAWSIAELN